MSDGNIGNFMTDFIQNIMRGDFSVFESVFYLAISIAIYSIFIWHFYRFIAKRDCFKISCKQYSKIVGFLKYFFVFPFVAFLFFIGLSLILSFLAKSLDVSMLLSTSFALIVAIRVTAYYNEDLSKDLAKMLPFALLGVFLVDPSYFDASPFEMTSVLTIIKGIPNVIIEGAKFIVLIILLEWVLRILLTIRYAILPKKNKEISEG